MNALEEIVTEKGEWVLAVGDPAALQAEKEKLFLRKPLEDLGKKQAGKECPAPPTE
jgi:hypothetical protein